MARFLSQRRLCFLSHLQLAEDLLRSSSEGRGAKPSAQASMDDVSLVGSEIGGETFRFGYDNVDTASVVSGTSTAQLSAVSCTPPSRAPPGQRFVFIGNVREDSAAAFSLMPGDIVLACGSSPDAKSHAELVDAVRSAVGILSLAIWRAGEVRFAALHKPSADTFLGITLSAGAGGEERREERGERGAVRAERRAAPQAPSTPRRKRQRSARPPPSLTRWWSRGTRRSWRPRRRRRRGR